MGVDGIEIDIFVCKSGELVVFHDKKLDRLTNSNGYIESLEYDSIRKISVLGEHKIPTLNEVLELIDGKVFLNIELKGSGTAEPTHKLLTPLLKQKSGGQINLLFQVLTGRSLKFFIILIKSSIAILTGADPLDAIPIAMLNALAVNPSFRALNIKMLKKFKRQVTKFFHIR